MKLMHTKLPEFIKKLKAAATKGSQPKACEIIGLENLKTAKIQSMRAGRIEQAVEDIAKMEDVDHIDVFIVPRIPETVHTAVVKGYDADGKPTHAILQVVGILHQTEDTLTHDVPDVEDRRPPIGNH
jgi:translation elongation factor EF-1beta